MAPWAKLALGLTGLGALALGGLVGRSFTMPSRQVAVERVEVAVNAQAVAEHLAQAVQIVTTSHAGRRADAQSHRDLRAWLRQTYPRVHGTLVLEQVALDSLLYTWTGTDPTLQPVLLLGHTDTVPVPDDAVAQWTHPPHAGVIADGYVWGRGTLDDKNAVVSIFEAAEALLARGYQPTRTVLFAFGHDEEIGGEGAMLMSQRLAARQVRPRFILDEGMAITQGMAPGIAGKAAFVGMAEKGYLSVELVARADGGHGSMPPPSTAAGRIGAAVSALEAHPLPGSLDGPAGWSFDYLGPEMSQPLRTVMANRWLLDGVLGMVLESKPSTNALYRTTTAVTMLTGSPQANVLPTQATAVINFRIRPGETTLTVLDHVRAVVGQGIEVRQWGGFANDPSPVSSPDAPAFALLQRAIREVTEDVVVAPSLTVGATDARHYTGLCDHVYRFSPITMTDADVKRIHGIDERVSLADLATGVAFYTRLIELGAAE